VHCEISGVFSGGPASACSSIAPSSHIPLPLSPIRLPDSEVT
jgi:hypothetical protein